MSWRLGNVAREIYSHENFFYVLGCGLAVVYAAAALVWLVQS